MTPQDAVSHLLAIPSCKMLRSIILSSFQDFIGVAIVSMKHKQYMYNGHGLRHDGNWDLAARIVVREGGAVMRPCTVMYGLCGVDGNLMEPISPLPAEDFADIEPLLQRILKDSKKCRQENGYSDIWKRSTTGYLRIWRGLLWCSLEAVVFLWRDAETSTRPSCSDGPRTHKHN